MTKDSNDEKPGANAHHVVVRNPLWSRAPRLISVLVAFASGIVYAQQQPPQQSALESAGGLQEVVVTAQKRSEDAQAVPVSLSVLTGSDLVEQGMQDVSDIAHFIPGVSVQRTGPAENTVIIRGVSSQAGVASTSTLR